MKTNVFQHAGGGDKTEKEKQWWPKKEKKIRTGCEEREDEH